MTLVDASVSGWPRLLQHTSCRFVSVPDECSACRLASTAAGRPAGAADIGVQVQAMQQRLSM